MRDALTLRAIFALACVVLPLSLGSCDPCDSSLDPVKCSDLCEGANPHKDCAKCRGPVRDISCPQCTMKPAAAGCPNAVINDGGVSDASTDGSMSGGAGGSGGSGGDGSGGTGGMGGSGGVVGEDGGVMGLLCGEDDDCPPAQAVCGDDNRCGACASNGDCALHAGALVCDVRPDEATTGRCVDCLVDEECSNANAPECVLGFCVQCEVHSDCVSLDTPACNPANYMCMRCTSDAACVGRGTRTLCDDRDESESDNAGECVECKTHADCDNPTPQCDGNGTCVACSGNDDACEDRMDGETPISFCNLREDAETFGECVQCTGDNEGACPGNRACEQSSGTCTNNDVDSLYVCDGCRADSECRSGMNCVEVSFGDASIGTYCIWAHATNNACADDDHLNMRPFSRPQTLPSLDGPSSMYCLPPTTCEAYKAADDETACDADDDCGLDIEDGFCPLTGDAALKCSYACETSNDCLATGISMCPSVGVKFCRP